MGRGMDGLAIGRLALVRRDSALKRLVAIGRGTFGRVAGSNTHGRRKRTIAGIQIVAMSGELTWDCMDLTSMIGGTSRPSGPTESGEATSEAHMQKSVKKNSVLTHEVKDDGQVIVIKVKDAGEVVFDRRQASRECDSHAAVHGWIQRLSDAAALDKGSTPEQKRAAIQNLADYYLGGATEWKRKAVGGGAAKFDTGLAIQAMCGVLTNGDLDKAERLVERTMAKREVGREEALKIWAETEQVAAEMARIKASRATKLSAADMLAEMEADEDEEESSEEQA